MASSRAAAAASARCSNCWQSLSRLSGSVSTNIRLQRVRAPYVVPICVARHVSRHDAGLLRFFATSLLCHERDTFSDELDVNRDTPSPRRPSEQSNLGETANGATGKAKEKTTEELDKETIRESAARDTNNQEKTQVYDFGNADGFDEDRADTERPWYLSIDAPIHPTDMLEPTSLPKLPDDSPEFLETLLKHISEDLGFDKLSILDLREIHPPPALGPNLIMILGNARGERHLHVSAGRFVRWLRSSHGISAAADGLLGPNQLKLKMKRKRKRDAILGARGVVPREQDDGIGTGWICVNLGAVGPKRGTSITTPYRSPDGKLAGFGDESAGLQTTVVFQMLTEEKRKEMDLEGLWTENLEKSKNRKKELDDIASGLIVPRANPQLRPNSHQRRRYSSMATQHRFFSQKSFMAQKEGSLHVSQSFASLVKKTDPTALERDNLSVLLANDASAKRDILEKLQSFIEKRPHKEQVHQLRVDESYQSTSRAVMRNLSCHDTFSHRVWLYYKDRELHLSRYGFSMIEALVDEFCTCGIRLDGRQDIIQLLKAAAIPASPEPISSHISLVLKIVRNVEERQNFVPPSLGRKEPWTHRPLLGSDIFTTLIDAFSLHPPSEEITRIMDSLYNLLVRSHTKCPTPDETASLLTACARQDHWNLFWKVWNLRPLYGLPRTARLYTLVFYTFAESKNRRRCQDVLRRCMDELVVEEPSIDLGDNPFLQQAAMECVRIADPEAEKVLEEVDRSGFYTGAATTPELRRKANQEFVRLMDSLRSKRILDTRGPARQANQIGPSFQAPLRDRRGVRRAARQVAREKEAKRAAMQTPREVGSENIGIVD